MSTKTELTEELIKLNDYKTFKFEYIDIKSIVVEPWTRLKCQFCCLIMGKL